MLLLLWTQVFNDPQPVRGRDGRMVAQLKHCGQERNNKRAQGVKKESVEAARQHNRPEHCLISAHL
jgi:hypothetical protein